MCEERGAVASDSPDKCGQVVSGGRCQATVTTYLLVFVKGMPSRRSLRNTRVQMQSRGEDVGLRFRRDVYWNSESYCMYVGAFAG